VLLKDEKKISSANVSKEMVIFRWLELFVLIWGGFVMVMCVAESNKCPCEDPPIEPALFAGRRNITSSDLRLCINVNPGPVFERLQSVLPRVEVVSVLDVMDDDTLMKSCTVFINVTDAVLRPTALTFEKDIPPDKQYLVCPGICRPVPYLYFPRLWWNFPESVRISPTTHQQLSCSVDTRMINHRHGSSNTVVHHMIQSLFWRRIMECYEHKVWKNAHLNSHHQVMQALSQAMLQSSKRDIAGHRRPIPVHHQSVSDHRALSHPIRNKISSLVVWVGSAATVSLINAQSLVLKRYPKTGPDAVIGWAATDITYPCSEGTTKCLGSNKYLKYIPGSAINFMPAGWACAQRRPLRALAHVLLLFDSEFILLADDDTFVNYELLLARYGRMLQNEMVTVPIYLGEFTGSTGASGHLTTQGLFAGGSGYVLGKAVLARLVAFEISDGIYSADNDKKPRNQEDEFRSVAQYQYLSVAAEGQRVSSQFCPAKNTDGEGSDLAEDLQHLQLLNPDKLRGSLTRASETSGDSCVLNYETKVVTTHMYVDNTNGVYSDKRQVDPQLPYRTIREGKFPLAVPLVDFCANLMSNENTCQHRFANSIRLL
jgi:hypothetical protein